jgi:tripartite-type tricarboxylate transporter receptor subunit TctC
MPALQRVLFSVCAMGIAIAALPGPSVAQQSYPTKPIRFIVPFTPGGTSDVLTRMITQKMSENWGHAVVIENRTGAGGTIGTGLVAKATPDGYTLLVSSAAFAISAALHTNLPYDAIRDFAGVTRLGFSTTALIVPASLGVKSVKELIALAQTKPVFFSHAGIGSATHMNGERFRLAAGIKVVPVGFKGAADATLEVIAGRVQFAIVGLASSLPHIQDRRLVAVAVGIPQRSPLLPEVPTIAETIPGYARDGSHSLLAPKGTPLAIRQQLAKEVARILELPDVKERLKNIDFTPQPSTPEEHERVVRADIEIFSGVVRAAGLRPDLAEDAKGGARQAAGKGGGM